MSASRPRWSVLMTHHRVLPSLRGEKETIARCSIRSVARAHTLSRLAGHSVPKWLSGRVSNCSEEIIRCSRATLLWWSWGRLLAKLGPLLAALQLVPPFCQNRHVRNLRPCSWSFVQSMSREWLLSETLASCAVAPLWQHLHSLGSSRDSDHSARSRRKLNESHR